ncbi:uncharacterized protein LOC104584835 [Brachypodium distachyon]|uniref:uncharacterized protein LOC104584835 n=1 Tax=Brachypodium distachyon TaxID=15368 RepID=UPI00052FF646|nr:uncharacterized protein LOC104584835 [Brachypodium distachyon]|eukprot:XP_024318883.1 uncharacterized protein LOC104584835 [Brachypodium distachyon]
MADEYWISKLAAERSGAQEKTRGVAAAGYATAGSSLGDAGSGDRVGGFVVDDRGLSEEQLDKIERDAYRELAERKASPPPLPRPRRCQIPPSRRRPGPLRAGIRQWASAWGITSSGRCDWQVSLAAWSASGLGSGRSVGCAGVGQHGRWWLRAALRMASASQPGERRVAVSVELLVSRQVGLALKTPHVNRDYCIISPHLKNPEETDEYFGHVPCHKLDICKLIFDNK